MIQPSPSQDNKIDGEDLDDEEVVICPAHPTRKAVVPQPSVGVGFGVILDDIAWCPKSVLENARHARCF
jgi:hypothetical protein